MTTQMIVRQPDGFLAPVGQSVHGMIDRGRELPAYSGYRPAAPSWTGLFGQPRPAGTTYRPGVMDPRVATRHEMQPMPSGTSSTDTDAHERLRKSVKALGPNGSRMNIRGDFLMACPGVLSRVPLEKTEARNVLEAQRAGYGDGFVYGSPVTNFSAAAERQMRRGGTIPETGQTEVRRHTTVERSPSSVITPGGMPKTAAFANVRGGVPTIPGTPILSGVESIVAATPFPGTAPLAVGTETFASSAQPGGPYQPAPVPVPNAGGPPPSGLLLTAGAVAALNPSWQGAYGKAGTAASVQALPAESAKAQEPRPSGLRGLVVAALVIGGLMALGRN